MNIRLKFAAVAGVLLLAVAAGLAACSEKADEMGETDETGGGDPTVEEVAFSYERGVYDLVVLPYRKAAIAAAAGGKAALVIYLHGGSSKGDDNEKPLAEKGVDSIANYLAAHRLKSVLLVPQCPADKSWGSAMNGALNALIMSYADDGNVDAGRIYIFGGSMGGTGTWGMVSAYPDLFAAAMPVAGDPSRCVAAEVARTPVYTVMGTADRIMDADAVAAFVARLSALGGTTRFELESGWTHEITCVESYTTTRLDWLFAQRR